MTNGHSIRSPWAIGALMDTAAVVIILMALRCNCSHASVAFDWINMQGQVDVASVIREVAKGSPDTIPVPPRWSHTKVFVWVQ